MGKAGTVTQSLKLELIVLVSATVLLIFYSPIGRLNALALLFVPFGLVWLSIPTILYFCAGATGLLADSIRAPKRAILAIVLSIVLASTFKDIWSETIAFHLRILHLMPLIWALVSLIPDFPSGRVI